jgi:hypothetical protein
MEIKKCKRVIYDDVLLILNGTRFVTLREKRRSTVFGNMVLDKGGMK